MTKVEELKSELESDVERMRDKVAAAMPDRGDVCADSQKVCVINALNALQRTVSGITAEDLVAG